MEANSASWFIELGTFLGSLPGTLPSAVSNAWLNPWLRGLSFICLPLSFIAYFRSLWDRAPAVNPDQSAIDLFRRIDKSLPIHCDTQEKIDRWDQAGRLIVDKLACGEITAWGRQKHTCGVDWIDASIPRDPLALQRIDVAYWPKASLTFAFRDPVHSEGDPDVTSGGTAFPESYYGLMFSKSQTKKIKRDAVKGKILSRLPARSPGAELLASRGPISFLYHLYSNVKLVFS